MLKNILNKLILIIIFYIIFVLIASDLALKMDKKLGINVNNKIINIKDKLIYAFSNEKILEKKKKEKLNLDINN